VTTAIPEPPSSPLATLDALQAKAFWGAATFLTFIDMADRFVRKVGCCRILPMQPMPPFTARANFFALAFGSLATFANMISFIVIGRITDACPKARGFHISGAALRFARDSSDFTHKTNLSCWVTCA
jgi:hypothetical protein